MDGILHASRNPLLERVWQYREVILFIVSCESERNEMGVVSENGEWTYSECTTHYV